MSEMDTEKIKCYVFPAIQSNMFVYVSGKDALVIDPHVSIPALDYLRESLVQQITILLTHEHYDHTSGVLWLTKLFSSRVICQALTAASLRNGKNNRPIVLAAKSINDSDSAEARDYIRSLPRGYTYIADETFHKESSFQWCGCNIRLIHTPGHSPGSCCIELDHAAIATGDSLIRRTPVITRFPGGSSRDFAQYTLPYLQHIQNHMLILPGHGETFHFHPQELDSLFRIS